MSFGHEGIVLQVVPGFLGEAGGGGSRCRGRRLALAFHLLDGRTLTIEGAPVYLSVRAVVIGPETEFWVELRVAPAERVESGG